MRALILSRYLHKNELSIFRNNQLDMKIIESTFTLIKLSGNIYIKNKGKTQHIYTIHAVTLI